jgi:adenylate cyclase
LIDHLTRVPSWHNPNPNVYGPAQDWAEGTLDGTAAPAAIAGRSTPPVVSRTFGFIDLCGFTAVADISDPDDLIALLWSFRMAVRQISAARGVRVAKWLGDGAMIVGLDPGATIATCVDICSRTYPLQARAGVTTGAALLFDGDDYVGRAPNLAARLCDICPAGATLASVDPDVIPAWIEVGETGVCAVRSLPDPVMVQTLKAVAGTELPALPGI